MWGCDWTNSHYQGVSVRLSRQHRDHILPFCTYMLVSVLGIVWRLRFLSTRFLIVCSLPHALVPNQSNIQARAVVVDMEEGVINSMLKVCSFVEKSGKCSGVALFSHPMSAKARP
jgi:hypothetical protein